MLLPRLLLCSLAAAAASSAHEVVSFDYGWRFQENATHDPPTPAPASPTPPPTPNPACLDLNATFPVAQDDRELYGLQRGAAKDAPSCALECCALGPGGCFAWQYNSTKGCWRGFFKKKSPPRAGWTGGSRAAAPPSPPPSPPSPPPPPPSGQPTRLPLPQHPAAAAAAFDDSGWQLLDLPHDYVVRGTYDQNTPSDQGPTRPAGGAGQSYLPRRVAYYRKRFSLPAEWAGAGAGGGQKVVWVAFEGVFRAAKFWLNGVPIATHAAYVGDAHGESGGAGMGGGYTGFTVRLDNATGGAARYGGGAANENVLAVYVDPRMGSGWFYEGGGIYRKTWLHAAPLVHVDADGLHVVGAVPAHAVARNGDGDGDGDGDGGAGAGAGAGWLPAHGARAAGASVAASARLLNFGPAAASPNTTVTFELFDAAGRAVGSATSAPVALGGAANTSEPTNATARATIALSGGSDDAQLWSVARPYLYTVRATVNDGGGGGGGGDAMNATLGFYTTEWTGDRGFFMNGEHVKIRGFCNHESFGGVGMAIPDRVNLFRAQALRSVGGNGWRMSHNPVSPVLYDVLDRVGVVAMDETRILGTDDISVMNMGAMVRRDRNHPSVVIWSYCNEGGCGHGDWGFRNVTESYDTSRPTLGNKEGFGDDGATDVAGFSHSPAADFDAHHASFPAKPSLASECCSCTSLRSGIYGGGEEEVEAGGLPGLTCTAEQSNRSNAREFMAGTMVWTLFDYYGESHGWPRVSSEYGQIDLAGFFKTTGLWYRTFWLSAVPESDAGRPVGFGAAHMCAPDPSGNGVTRVRVLTEAPIVELYIDGNLTESVAVAPLQAAQLMTPLPAFSAANVTVACVGADGSVSGRRRLAQPGNATALRLTLDAPSALTGTGEALLLDGHDVAMLRATVVDAAGVTVPTSGTNVSFEVTAGPGRVLASHNGDNACHEPNDAAWHSSFVGLVRAFVQVTEHSVGSVGERRRLASIDCEVAHTTVPLTQHSAATSITVTASSPGLASATVQIPVSADSAHGVLQAAERSLASEQRWQ